MTEGVCLFFRIGEYVVKVAVHNILSSGNVSATVFVLEETCDKPIITLLGIKSDFTVRNKLIFYTYLFILHIEFHFLYETSSYVYICCLFIIDKHAFWWTFFGLEMILQNNNSNHNHNINNDIWFAANVTTKLIWLQCFSCEKWDISEYLTYCNISQAVTICCSLPINVWKAMNHNNQ